MNEDVKKWIDEIIDWCEKLNSIPTYKDEIFIFSPVIRGHELHVDNIQKLADALGVECIRVDWDGNKKLNTNWDELYFMYRDYRVFSLVKKIEEEENERK